MLKWQFLISCRSLIPFQPFFPMLLQCWEHLLKETGTVKEAEAFEKEKSKKEGQSFPRRGAAGTGMRGAPGGAGALGRQGALGCASSTLVGDGLRCSRGNSRVCAQQVCGVCLTRPTAGMQGCDTLHTARCQHPYTPVQTLCQPLSWPPAQAGCLQGSKDRQEAIFSRQRPLLMAWTTFLIC